MSRFRIPLLLVLLALTAGVRTAGATGAEMHHGDAAVATAASDDHCGRTVAHPAPPPTAPRSLPGLAGSEGCGDCGGACGTCCIQAPAVPAADLAPTVTAPKAEALARAAGRNAMPGTGSVHRPTPPSGLDLPPPGAPRPILYGAFLI